MAGYSTSAPPSLLAQRVGGATPAVWVYSNTDADSTVYGAGYFTNGSALGMEKGDFVIYLKTDTPAIYLHVVTSVTAGGAATVGSTAATCS